LSVARRTTRLKETSRNLRIGASWRKRNLGGWAMARGRAPGTVMFRNYPDVGCEAAPHCLTCPLAVCVEDDPGYIKRREITERIEAVIHIQRLGVPIAEIASEIGRSPRTVHRYLKEVANG